MCVHSEPGAGSGLSGLIPQALDDLSCSVRGALCPRSPSRGHFLCEAFPDHSSFPLFPLPLCGASLPTPFLQGSAKTVGLREASLTCLCPEPRPS